MNRKYDFALTGLQMEAQALVYMHEHFKKNGSNLKNRWVWYDKAFFKEISDYLQKNAQIDGVRIYYGIYNRRVCEYLEHVKQGSQGPQPNYMEYVDHNSAFFVPTYGKHRTEEGSDAEQETSEDGIPTTDIARFRKHYQNNDPIPLPAIGGFNAGHICPPPRKCGNSGSKL